MIVKRLDSVRVGESNTYYRCLSLRDLYSRYGFQHSSWKVYTDTHWIGVF